MMLLGIDPGNNKCGWALVNSDSSLYASGIIPSHIPVEWINALALTGESRINLLQPWIIEKPDYFSNEPVSYIILGTGTGSKKVEEQLLNYRSGLRIVLAEEKFTTLEARDFFWKLHPPGGFRKYLPISLLTPPRDIDDLAAWVIVLHKIETEKGE
ncbi:MAG: endonuclease [Synergistaceae bacterium]|nr:endonuclease [Synergistaceae bacterium]